MNKQELVSRVAEQMATSKKDAAKWVESIIGSISDALKSGEKVQLVGFGNFEVRDRAERMGRNPQTGQEIKIAASRVPVFRPGKILKEHVRKF